MKTKQYAVALSQLCHESTTLAHSVWIDLFPSIWSALSDKYRQVLVLLYNTLTDILLL